MPGAGWWCQLRPPLIVYATEIATAPPSGKRESCAAAMAFEELVGFTAASGSTTVSGSEPAWDSTSWRVTWALCSTTGLPDGAATASVDDRRDGTRNSIEVAVVASVSRRRR